MSIGSAFIIILMFCFLAFMVYRWYVKKDYLLAIIAGLQTMIFVFAAICFATRTQISNINEAVFIVVGILLPGYFLIIDYNNMIKTANACGVPIKLVQSVTAGQSKQIGMDDETGIMDIVDDILPSILIKSIHVDKDEILRNVKRNIIRARGLAKRNDFVKARQIHESIIMTIGNSAWMLFSLGNLYYRSSMYSDAAKTYKKALRACDMHGRSYTESVEEVDTVAETQASDRKNIDNSNAAFDKSIIYYNFANACFKVGEYQEAVDAYAEALRINPSFENAKENTAKSLMWLGRFNDAEEYYKRIVANDAYSFKAHLSLGTIYSDLKRYDEAIEELSTALKLSPNSAVAYHALGRIYIKVGKYNEAIDVYTKYLSKYPGDYRAYYNIGMALYNLNKNKEAIEAFERALEIQPNYFEAKYNIGVIFDEMSKTEEAIKVFREVIDAKPDFVDAYNNLGIILSTKERYLEALNVYIGGLKKNPNSYSLYYNMGLTLSAMKRYDDAVEAFRNAIDIKSDEYEIYYHYGTALTQTERYSEAAAAFKKAIKYKPDYAECHYNLSVVYSIMRKYDYAVESLEKAISLNKEFKEKAGQNDGFNNLRGKFEFERLIS